MLKGRPEVSDIRCVKDAKVPLMRFEFEGIPIDFPYAQLQVISIPEVSLIFHVLICSLILYYYYYFNSNK